jgi:hypothetical protein
MRGEEARGGCAWCEYRFMGFGISRYLEKDLNDLHRYIAIAAAILEEAGDDITGQ